MRSLIKFFLQKYRKRNLKACGCNSYIAKNCTLYGNIYIGSNVALGKGAHFVSTRANLCIHDHVIFGPYVTIYTGDHPMDVIGKHISELKDEDKSDPMLDQDVIIESGCWIGTHAIILKGVTIGRGSVIGAGAVVTRSVPPYSVYVGASNVRIFARFDENEIKKHEELLEMRGEKNDAMTCEVCF